MNKVGYKVILNPITANALWKSTYYNTVATVIDHVGDYYLEVQCFDNEVFVVRVSEVIFVDINPNVDFNLLRL